MHQSVLTDKRLMMKARDHLLMAIKSNSPEAVARLVHDVDLKEEIEDKLTPIQRARHWDCVEAIAKSKKTDAADAARYGSALMYAVRDNRLQTAKILLDAGASNWVTETKDTNLHQAVRNRSTTMIKLLFPFNPIGLTRTNEDNRTPIQLACELSYWDCVEAIAESKRTDSADQARYSTALSRIIDEDRFRILHKDTRQRFRAARILLEAGASPNAASSYKPFELLGDRCLHVAVRNDNKKMIALLLSFGADINAKNKTQTPAELATSLNRTCLTDGWKIYYHNETLAILNLLAIFVQGNRQPSSKLFNIPNSVLELLLPMISRESLKSRDTIRSRMDNLTKISANCLIKSYQGLFRQHSPASQEFVTELKQVLQTSQYLTKDVGKTVSHFLSKNPDKDSRTVNLLNRYKLKGIAIKSKEEENKEQVASASPSSRKD